MKRYQSLIIIIGVMFLILIALTYIKPGKKDVLDGSIWRVEEFNSTPIIEFTTLTMRFHNQKINGSSECNRFKGRYEIRGDLISIEVTERTVEGCMKPDVIEQDEALISSLEQVVSFIVSGNDLKFYDQEEQELLDLALMAE
jgi:heat shock protein HslJ